MFAMRSRLVRVSSLLFVGALAAGCGDAETPEANPSETSPQAGPTGGKADIYGEDNRRELYQASSLIRNAARSTAVVSTIARLYVGDDGNIWTRATSWSDSVRASEGAPLCQSEAFREQPVGGHCSAFLIAPDLVATAGHCVNVNQTCEELRFIFDYAYTSSSRSDSVRRVEREDLYQCAAVLGHLYDRDAASAEDIRSREYWSDWAVIKLDRPVSGREPLPLRSSGSPRVGDGVTTIGYPGGIPAKATSGTVKENAKELYFNTDLDIYGGNSGGVVVGGQGIVEGIVIRGTGGKSFHREGDCMASDRCDAYTGSGTCTGNHVQRIGPVLQFTDTERVLIERHDERFTFNERQPGVVEFVVDDPGDLRYVTLDTQVFHWNPKEIKISIERVGRGSDTLFNRSTLKHTRFSRTTQEFTGQPARGVWRVRFEDVEGNNTSDIAVGDVRLILGIGQGVSPAPRQTFIGSECASDADCTFSQEASCRAYGGGGYCVIPCQGYCPDRAGFATTFCVASSEGGGECVPKSHAANASCDLYAGITASEAERYIGASSAPASSAIVCR